MLLSRGVYKGDYRGVRQGNRGRASFLVVILPQTLKLYAV